MQKKEEEHWHLLTQIVAMMSIESKTMRTEQQQKHVDTLFGIEKQLAQGLMDGKTNSVDLYEDSINSL